MASETILVIDDGPENRDFIVEYILKPNGFEWLLAADGREGLKIAIEQQPDLILLDLQMPRMNGIEVVNALSQRNIDTPVVLMTFHGSEEIAIEVFRMGVKDYVRKPYSVDEMLSAISRALSERRLRKEKDSLVDRMVVANQELQRRVHELNVLYRVGKRVTSTVSLDELVIHIVDAAIQLTGAEEGTIYLTEGNQTYCRAEKQLSNSSIELNNYPVDDDLIIQHVIKEKRDVIATQEQLNSISSDLNGAVFTPIMFQDNVTGIISVANRTSGTRQFTKNDGALLSALSDYAAIAIQNSRYLMQQKKSQQLEREKIRGTFERFVAPSIVERVLSNPSELELGGTRQEVSIVFADIRGYTAWSEKFPPEKVMEMLNDYLSLAAEVVLGWEGTLDKFFGDGLMAIFNAPEPMENHVHRATDVALALLKAADELNARKGYGLSYSVGVNVGEAVVGYVGTNRALNYTAIGDVVNLAKRLQENAPPGQILVEQGVVERLGKLAHAKFVGEIKIRNRRMPAKAYQLHGLDPIPSA